jgi:hypothetical protein
MVITTKIVEGLKDSGKIENCGQSKFLQVKSIICSQKRLLLILFAKCVVLLINLKCLLYSDNVFSIEPGHTVVHTTFCATFQVLSVFKL